MSDKPLADRLQVPGGSANPIGERGTIEIDALTSVNLRLTIHWEVVRVFADEHMGDGRFRRQATLDQPRRGRRLQDGFFASPARIFGTARDQHPELSRHDVEPLAHVLRRSDGGRSHSRGRPFRRRRPRSRSAAGVPAAIRGSSDAPTSVAEWWSTMPRWPPRPLPARPLRGQEASDLRAASRRAVRTGGAASP